MRRVFRWVLIVFILLVVLVGILLIPAVQKSLFLTIASGEDRTVSVEYFHVGPSGLRIENLEFSGPGILARVPAVESRFSWGELLQGRLLIWSFSAEDVFLKLDQPSEKDSTPEDSEEPFEVPKDFSGILQQPFPLEIEQMLLSGRVVTESTDELKFLIEAENLIAGQTGNLQLRLDPGSSSPETVPSFEFSLPIAISEGGNLEEIRLAGEITSRVPDLEGVLDLEGAVSESEEGESYRIRLTSSRLLPGGEILIAGGLNRAERRLSFRLDARGDNLDFLQMLTPEPLPKATFEISGETELRPGQGFQAAGLSFQVNAESLPGFDEPMSAVGATNFSTGKDDGVTLDQLELSIGPPQDARPWIALRLLKPQVFRGGDSLEIPKDRFAAVEIFLPAEFLNTLDTNWEFSDFKAEGDLVGSENGMTLETESPWTTAVNRSGRSDSPVVVNLVPSVTYQGGEVSVTAGLSLSGSNESMQIDLSGSLSEVDSPRVSFEVSAVGGLGVLESLVPESSEMPTGSMSTTVKGTFEEVLNAEGSLSLERFVAGRLKPAEIDLKVEELSVSTAGGISLGTVLDFTWKTSDGETSLSGLQLAAKEQESGRWSISVEEGNLVADPKAFGVEETSADFAPDTDPESPTGSGLPEPKDLAVFRDPPLIPLDIEKFNLVGEVFLKEESRRFELALKDIKANEEGTFSLQMDEGAESPLKGRVDGQVRLGEDGVLSRIKAVAHAESVALGNAVTDLIAELVFSPTSPVDPLTLAVGTSEGTAPILFVRSSFSDEEASAVVEADFANWVKSPLRSLTPNLATGHLNATAVLDENGVRLLGGFDAVTPLDGFESYELTFEGLVPSTKPLNAKVSVVLTDAKDKQSDVIVQVLGNRGNSVNLQVDGNRVDLEAMEGFARVWASPQEKDEDAPISDDDSADGEWPLASLPFSIEGTLSVGELIPQGFPAARMVEGKLFADTEKATLRVAANWMEDSSLSMEGRISRDAGAVEGAVDAKVSRLPLGKLLRELNPQETPSIEGLASIGLSFKGSAASLAELPDWMVGTLSADMQNGVIRSLRPGTRVTRLVGAGSIAGVLAGSALRRPGIVALSEIVNLFKEVPYSQLSAKLERTEERETVIESLLFQGPYLAMQGSGKVESGDLDAIPTTPMQLNLKFGSKPPLSGPLDVLALLGTAVDSNGYREWKQPIQLSGTFAQPDPGDLWALILGAVERAATMSEGDLRREREQRGEALPEKSKKPSTEERIQEGVNSILNILGN